jgi:KUP system potassium uptake protein
MVTLVALIVWKLRPRMVFLPWLAISAMDGAFLSSALLKVPDGAWFTITLAAVLTAVFVLWRFGKEAQWSAERQHCEPLSHFVQSDDHGHLRLTASTPRVSTTVKNPASPLGEQISTTQGFGIFFDKSGAFTPLVFSQFISKLVSKPAVSVFFHLRPIETPTVALADRYIVRQLPHLSDCYRVVARYGYMDEVVTPDLAALIYDRVRDYILLRERGGGWEESVVMDSFDERKVAVDTDAVGLASSDIKHPLPLPTRAAASSEDELQRLQQAFDHRVLYIIGKEELHLASTSNLWRRVWLKMFLFVRENTRNKMANLKVSTDRLVEIGWVMEV